MKSSMFRRSAVVVLATATLFGLTACSGGDSGTESPAAAEAPEFPTSKITMIVPYAAGGNTDLSARALAKDLEEELGQTIIVENRPGASGITGLSEVSLAKPDGYTIAYSTGDGFVQSALREGVAYSFDSFDPVVGTITQPYIFVTGKDSRVGDFDALKGLDKVTFAVTGIGTPTHINTQQLFDQLGTEATAVPFDGVAPAVQALVGGQTDVAMLDVSAVMPFIKSDDLRVLGVLTPDAEPLDYLEGAPTLEELGLDTDLMTLTQWGVAVPTGTDPAVVEVLRTASLAALEGGSFVEFAEANYMPLLTPEAEKTWYQDLAATAEKTNQALKQFGITLS